VQNENGGIMKKRKKEKRIKAGSLVAIIQPEYTFICVVRHIKKTGEMNPLRQKAVIWLDEFEEVPHGQSGD
jgi:hypothetical protein